jgi:hypothetical protein
MKNIDHRKKRSAIFEEKDTRHWGGRIRQMNVSRNYPKTELVIKRAHTSNAIKTIESIQKKVRKFNETRSEHSILLMPKAYAIGKDLIAMSKINVPT